MGAGGGINRAAENLSQMFIQLMLENRRMGLQQQQIGQEQQRIDLATRQQGAAEQSSALERLIAMAPFLPEGKAIGEMPELHDTLKTAFPEFDPTHPGDLGGVVLNKQTVEDLLQPMLVAHVNALPDAQKNQLLERASNRAALGVPASTGELQAQDTRAGMFLQAWDTLKGDPHALEGILRTQVGLEVPTRVQYQGREITFDTAAAANITAQLMQHRDQMGLQYAQMNRGQQLDLAGELIGQMQKNNITLGRAAAMSIVGAYNQMASLASQGTLTSDNNPLQKLYDNSGPEVQTSIRAFNGAVSFGSNGYQQYLQSTPNGRQLLNFIQLGQALHEGGMPQKNIPGILEQITSSQQNFGQGQGGFELPHYSAPGFFSSIFGGNTLTFHEPQATQPSGPSVESLRAQMQSDANDLAHGRISAADIGRKYRDPHQRAAVIQASRTMRH
jgi:hypothetical protein